MKRKTIIVIMASVLMMTLTACSQPDGTADNTALVNAGQVDEELSSVQEETKDIKTEITESTREDSQESTEPEKEITFTVPEPGSGIEGFLATKLDLDYTGELFPGSGIDIGATDEYLASQGIMLCSFVVTDGDYKDMYFVYTPATTLKLGCGVWGDGTEETATRLQGELEAIITSLYAAGNDSKSADNKSADASVQQQAAEQTYNGVTQSDIDQLCRENGNADSLIVQLDNDSRWYCVTASWAGGGMKEISEAEAVAYTQAPAPATSTTTASEQSGTPALATDMLSLVNADREANGIGGLSWSDDLAQIALQRVTDIKANYDAGTDPHAGAGNYNFLGENAAAGQTGTSAANTAWINSSAHHGNRLCDTDTEYACAYLYVPGSAYGYYWVEIFR